MDKRKKLAIVATHPIQYNSPWFRLLAQSDCLSLKVFYTWSQAVGGSLYDPGFGKVIEWDIPLLEGYEFEVVENKSGKPGKGSYWGIDNPGLIQAIETWQADALLVMGWNFKSHLSCMRYFKGRIPVLFRGDSTLLNETAGIKKLLRRSFLSWVYSYVDLALYVGRNNYHYFRAHGLKEEQLKFAPHAIDNDRFSGTGTAAEVAAMRSAFGCRPEDFVVLFAGKFDPVKSPSSMIELAKKIKDSRLRVVMVGNGVLEDELRSMAKDDDRIRFVGFQNQRSMPLVYKAADLVVLPSKSETWGLALNEAMACSRPVLASNRVGGAIDLVKNGENGFIFAHGHIDQALPFVEKLMTDAGFRKKVGESASAIVAGFSFRHITRAIEEAIC